MAQLVPQTGLNENHTLSFAGHFQATGSALNLELPFYPDMLEVYNYTKAGTAGEVAKFSWFKDFPAGDAIVEKVIADSGATGNQNYTLETANGVTVNNTDAGVTSFRYSLTGATQAKPVVITTSTAHAVPVGDKVRGRITGVKGMTQINDISRNPYELEALSTTTFALRDIHGNDIDGTSFSAYTSGGEVNLFSYNSDALGAVEYDKDVYKLTLGSAIAANNGDELYFVAWKFSSYTDLGDAANW